MQTHTNAIGTLLRKVITLIALTFTLILTSCGTRVVYTPGMPTGPAYGYGSTMSPGHPSNFGGYQGGGYGAASQGVRQTGSIPTGYDAVRCKFNHSTGKWEPVAGANWHVGMDNAGAKRAMQRSDHKDPNSEAHNLGDPSYPGDGKPWEKAGPPGS